MTKQPPTIPPSSTTVGMRQPSTTGIATGQPNSSAMLPRLTVKLPTTTHATIATSPTNIIHAQQQYPQQSQPISSQSTTPTPTNRTFSHFEANPTTPTHVVPKASPTAVSNAISPGHTTTPSLPAKTSRPPSPGINRSQPLPTLNAQTTPSSRLSQTTPTTIQATNTPTTPQLSQGNGLFTSGNGVTPSPEAAAASMTALKFPSNPIALTTNNNLSNSHRRMVSQPVISNPPPKVNGEINGASVVKPQRRTLQPAGSNGLRLPSGAISASAGGSKETSPPNETEAANAQSNSTSQPAGVMSMPNSSRGVPPSQPAIKQYAASASNSATTTNAPNSPNSQDRPSGMVSPNTFLNMNQLYSEDNPEFVEYKKRWEAMRDLQTALRRAGGIKEGRSLLSPVNSQAGTRVTSRATSPRAMSPMSSGPNLSMNTSPQHTFSQTVIGPYSSTNQHRLSPSGSPLPTSPTHSELENLRTPVPDGITKFEFPVVPVDEFGEELPTASSPAGPGPFVHAGSLFAILVESNRNSPLPDSPVAGFKLLTPNPTNISLHNRSRSQAAANAYLSSPVSPATSGPPSRPRSRRNSLPSSPGVDAIPEECTTNGATGEASTLTANWKQVEHRLHGLAIQTCGQDTPSPPKMVSPTNAQLNLQSPRPIQPPQTTNQTTTPSPVAALPPHHTRNGSIGQQQAAPRARITILPVSSLVDRTNSAPAASSTTIPPGSQSATTTASNLVSMTNMTNMKRVESSNTLRPSRRATMNTATGVVTTATATIVTPTGHTTVTTPVTDSNSASFLPRLTMKRE